MCCASLIINKLPLFAGFTFKMLYLCVITVKWTSINIICKEALLGFMNCVQVKMFMVLISVISFDPTCQIMLFM